MEDTSLFQGQEINLCNESLKVVEKRMAIRTKLLDTEKVESPTQMGKLVLDVNPLRWYFQLSRFNRLL